MKKEEIYLDLSKLSKSERKEVFELLPPEKEIDDYLINSCYHYLVKTDNKWFVTSQNYLYKRIRVTFKQFKELFNTIQLDKTKAYDLRDLSEEQKEVAKELFDLNMNSLNNTQEDITFYDGEDWLWCIGRQYEKLEIIKFKSLFEPQLKIGDTFEHNGFICEVKSVKKEPIKVGDWIMNDRKMFFKYEKWMADSPLWVKITDQEFINQLEKHAR